MAEATQHEEIKGDEEMLEKTSKIIKRLESFAKEGINERVLMTVLKTQSLVGEIYNAHID